MTSQEEANLLEKTLASHDSLGAVPYHSSSSDGNSNEEKNQERTLNFTMIKFKSKEAIRIGHEMNDFQDKSFYLNEIILKKYYDSSIDNLFGELQFAFLNTILFCNYASSLQWHNILELICFSKQVEQEKIDELDHILQVQIKLAYA